MGAAVSGGIGIGIWKDFSKVDEMIEIASVSQPRGELRAVYDRLYEIFNEAYDALDGPSLFRRLAELDAV